MYFGDVICQPGGIVVRDPDRRDRAQHVQSTSRKAIEEHLLGRPATGLRRITLEARSRPLQRDADK